VPPVPTVTVSFPFIPPPHGSVVESPSTRSALPAATVIAPGLTSVPLPGAVALTTTVTWGGRGSAG